MAKQKVVKIDSIGYNIKSGRMNVVLNEDGRHERYEISSEALRYAVELFNEPSVAVSIFKSKKMKPIILSMRKNHE